MFEVIVIDGPHRGYIWKTETAKPQLMIANHYPDNGYSVHDVIKIEDVFVAKFKYRRPC